MGLPQKLAPGVKKIIMRESTGNADAVNGWDSNAAAGTPSKGLMQLIDTTFRNSVLPSLADKGIFDPVANITAGVRTMIANHGIDAVMDGGLRELVRRLRRLRRREAPRRRARPRLLRSRPPA